MTTAVRTARTSARQEHAERSSASAPCRNTTGRAGKKRSARDSRPMRAQKASHDRPPRARGPATPMPLRLLAALAHEDGSLRATRLVVRIRERVAGERDLGEAGLDEHAVRCLVRGRPLVHVRGAVVALEAEPLVIPVETCRARRKPVLDVETGQFEVAHTGRRLLVDRDVDRVVAVGPLYRTLHPVIHEHHHVGHDAGRSVRSQDAAVVLGREHQTSMRRRAGRKLTRHHGYRLRDRHGRFGRRGGRFAAGACGQQAGRHQQFGCSGSRGKRGVRLVHLWTFLALLSQTNAGIPRIRAARRFTESPGC